MSEVLIAFSDLKPGVLVKSSLMFESGNPPPNNFPSAMPARCKTWLTRLRAPVSRALYGISVSVRYFKSGESAELIRVLTSKEACVLVLTEQALLECNSSHYTSVAVLYQLLPPGPGIELLVGEFRKSTVMQVSEPHIEPSLLETGALAFKSCVNVEVSIMHREMNADSTPR